MVRANKAGDLCGVLVVDKPVGISSMGAVAAVRRRAGGVRTGHAGTLDPLAEGVLIVAVGRATKSLGRFMATDKRYRTVIDLGAFTSTDDREGERAEVEVEQPPREDDVRDVLRRFIGDIRQRPPARSAVKVGGRRAYHLARQGRSVELAERTVSVHALELVRYQWPLIEIDVRCGKGTYIRSLARDVGAALGTGGHCAMLRRTAVGPFTESISRRLDDLPASITQADLIPLEEALRRIDES